MKNAITSINIGLFICCFAFTTYSEIKNVILFVGTAQGAIGHSQATASFEIMMKDLAKEHRFDLTIQNGRSNASWPGTFVKIPEADIIIFGNSGEPSFNDKNDQQVLINYFLNGGRAIGYGATCDISRYWDWWQNVLHSGSDYNGNGKAKFTLDKDPAVDANPELKKMWEAHELGEPTIQKTEIVKFTQYPRGKDSVTIMQTVRPPNNYIPNHDFTWLRDIGKGKYIYTALGHASNDFESGWLQKATWAWMEYLDGRFGESTSVSKLEFNPSLVVFSFENVSIKYSNQWNIKILNVNGETIFAESNIGIKEYSLSGLQAGLYFVKVSAAGSSVFQRIVIQ